MIMEILASINPAKIMMDSAQVRIPEKAFLSVAIGLFIIMIVGHGSIKN